MSEIYHIKTISEAHQAMGLTTPKHPLISFFYHVDLPAPNKNIDIKFSSDLYLIGMKDGVTGVSGYGRNSYDFQEGTMIFIEPNQILTAKEFEVTEKSKGWTILFHPDLILAFELARDIKGFSYFSYDVNEALHLSEDEMDSLTQLALKIVKEYSQNIDKHTGELMVANLGSILKYCQRYYDRQFFTRTNLNRGHIEKFESFLNEYFKNEQNLDKGLPTVEQCGEALNISGHYLSDLLKIETGKSIRDHIHSFVIDKAKYGLLNTNKTVNEIAFEMGFDYPQSFSRLFKAKTGLSPKQFRSLN